MKRSSFREVLESLRNSMIGYEVNGNPQQRMFALQNIAKYITSKQVKMDLFISCRESDRYGTNYLPVIACMYMYEKIYPGRLFYDTNEHWNRYDKNILHEYMLKKSNVIKDVKTTPQDINKLLPGHWGLRWITDKVYKTTSQPFPDAFHSSHTYNELRDMYLTKYAHVGTPVRDSVVIHVRLDDIRTWSNSGHQRFIGHDNLVKLINYTVTRFGKTVYLLTTPNPEDIKLCTSALQHSNCILKTGLDYKDHVLGTDDIDYDIYHMIQCDTLITSRSTYSFIGAILNSNTCYTYTGWEHYFDLLGTNIKQSFFGDHDGTKCDKFQILDDYIYDESTECEVPV